MDGYVAKVVLISGSYLLGAIPFGLITTKVMGRGDIRKMGSGNIGATNVLRSAGKLGGFVTLLLDSLKGVLPLLLAKSWWDLEIWTFIVAVAAVLGHNYPVYLKFKGGKGVATSLGVVTALWPYIGLITIAVWLAAVVIWKYSSLGALISFAMFPMVVWVEERSLTYFLFSLLISLMIFYRHRENIKRLMAGTEKKIGKGGGSALLLVIFFFFAGISSAEAGIIPYASAIPHDVEKQWDLRRSALSAGNRETADALLNNIIETKYILGVNRIDEISALLVREGYQALEKGSYEDAYSLSKKAKEISPHYAPSYFLAGKALFKMSKTMPGVSEYIEGLKDSVQDFWTLFNMIGRVYAVVTIAVTLTFLTFFVVWFSRLMPIFYHTFREITCKYIDRPFLLIFWGIIIIFPLLFGIVWFIIFWIVGVWIYLMRKERIIAVLIMVFFLLLPQGLKYSTIFITGGENIALQGVLAIDKGYGDRELIKRLQDQYRKEPGDEYLPLSIAYLLYKQGDIKESLDYYQKLLNTDKKNIRAWTFNGLGNLYFKEGDYDTAILYYTKAISDSPMSEIPVYNLSQAYREKLMFAEAESTYATAKKINPDKVGRYSTLSIKGKGYKVIDFPISNYDLWTIALRPSEGSNILAMGILKGAIRIPSNRLPFLGVSILIILTVLSYLKPRTPMAYSCPKCRRTVCGWCIGSRIFGTTCKECKGKDHQSEEARELDRRISFILPGLWHIYKGKVLSGGFISLLFFLGLSGLILGEMNDTWDMAYYLSGKAYMSWFLFVILSYLLITFHFKYVKIRIDT